MSATAILPPRQLYATSVNPQSALPPNLLHRDENILAQMCGNNFMVLKAAPPLVVTLAQPDESVAAVREVVELAHTYTRFRSEALGTARRALAG
jgi:acetylornithine/succinyldiaminopimelate/putrescine aminotransferase